MTKPESIDDFYARHAAGGPSHVVIAHLIFANGDASVGIFSSIDKARAWADTMDEDDSCRGCVFAPYIIDVPEFGNVPFSKRQ